LGPEFGIAKSNRIESRSAVGQDGDEPLWVSLADQLGAKRLPAVALGLPVTIWERRSLSD
jgi:hypothetical protein